jgi:predicted permease
MIGVVVGIVLFCARIKLPNIIFTPMQYMAGLNTPVAMLLLGAFLANVEFKSVFKNPHLYIVSAIRLLAIPLLGCLIFKFFNLSEIVYLSVVIPDACPIATMIALFAQRYNENRSYASQIVAINTLMSVLTIPFVVYISSFIR